MGTSFSKNGHFSESLHQFADVNINKSVVYNLGILIG